MLKEVAGVEQVMQELARVREERNVAQKLVEELGQGGLDPQLLEVEWQLRLEEQKNLEVARQETESQVPQ